MAGLAASTRQGSAALALSGSERQAQTPSSHAGDHVQNPTTPPKAPQSPPYQSLPRPLQPSSPGGREDPTSFSSDDDARLERYVKAKVESGGRWNSISTYEDLAKEVSVMTS